MLTPVLSDLVETFGIKIHLLLSIPYSDEIDSQDQGDLIATEDADLVL